MSARPDPIVNQVLAHANRVHNLLESQGRTEAAERLGAEAQQWGQAQTTVVVAGDVKRGKSSLVNALVNRPDLLPVDADVATAVHLVITHGESERITVTTLDGETFDIQPDQLESFASMKADEATLAGVTAVEVVVDDPLLERGLHIVDTPGVGGMTRGHRDITMAALQQADVLMFVVSLQEPVALSELEFLTEASERIGNVVLVGSRSDLSTDDANAAMAADLSARIATLAGQVEGSRGDGEDHGEAEAKARRLRRLSERPVVITSSYLAEQARRRAERGREEAAADLRRRSGLDDLIAHLDRAVGARDQVRLANLLQLTSVLLAGAEDELTLRRRAIDGDSSAEEELRQRQEQLERAVSNQARWRTSLGSSISRLQTSTSREINRELGLVRDHYRDLLDRTDDPVELEQVGNQVQQSLQAAWTNLAGQVASRFNDLIAKLLDDLEIESDADLFGELEVPPAIQAGTTRTRSDDQSVDMLQDVLPLATQSFMFGNIANVAAGLLGVATGGLGFMAYGIGAAMAAPIVAIRRKQRMRHAAAQQIHRELTEALFGQEGIARELSTEMTLRIIDAREQLEQLIEDRLVSRRRELEARRKELQEILRTEMASRSDARKSSEEAISRLRGLREETDRLTSVVDAELARLFEAEAAAGAEPAVDQPAAAG